MLMLLLLLPLLLTASAHDITRDFFGDVFRMRDCHNGSRCDAGGGRAALQVPGRPCFCQCAPSHIAYREDKQQCVKDIKECYMSVFYRPFTVEAIPLVYLPTSGQLVHPDAHLSLSMRRNFEGGLAKCRVTVSQQLTREGWRTLTKMDGTGGSVFGLFTDVNKTYLQFLGSSHDRKLLQQHMVLVRLLCVIPQYPAFETCVAIRIGWVPGAENIEDAPAPSNKANMMVVGLSLGVLALVYIFAVLVYLKIRRQMIAKQKANIDQEAKLQSRDDTSDKASTLHRMEASNRLELYHSASLGRQKTNRKGYRNNSNSDPWHQMSPLVETYNRTWTDRMGQHSSEFRAQDLKLRPEFFEPESMASPPHEVLEYLERLQNSITFARHRMRSCYRYQPTLNGIPEDDYFYQELEKKKDPQQQKKKDEDGMTRTTPDGGSASSLSSLQEDEAHPKVPPRKPKRKGKPPTDDHDEQREIQKAMSTLNDTLDALEHDIYKQEIANTGIDPDDFETSSCSSMSAVTVLGKHPDIAKCGGHYFEKNQSEEFSTFSNSTYSLCGLFHDGNKSATSCNVDPDIGNRCSSADNDSGQSKDGGNENGTVATSCLTPEKRAHTNEKPESRADDFTGGDRNSDGQNIPGKPKCIQKQEHDIKKDSRNPAFENINTLGRDPKLPNIPNHECKQRNLHSLGTKAHGARKSQRPNLAEDDGVSSPEAGVPQSNIRTFHRRLRTPTKEKHVGRNVTTPTQEKASRDTPQSSRGGGENRANTLTKKGVESPKVVSAQKMGESPSPDILRRSPSSESMTTDMTTDSLDSRCATPSPTPSLVDMWLQRLVTSSSKNRRRKSRGKAVLPEKSWEHVCQKQKELNDSEPNLIERLAHYGSRTMAGCDVAGYFQSLRQDVLRQWLTDDHRRPLVGGQERSLGDEDDRHRPKQTVESDSLESDSSRKENGNVYFGDLRGTHEKTVHS